MSDILPDDSKINRWLSEIGNSFVFLLLTNVFGKKHDEVVKMLFYYNNFFKMLVRRGSLALELLCRGLFHEGLCDITYFSVISSQKMQYTVQCSMKSDKEWKDPND